LTEGDTRQSISNDLEDDDRNEINHFFWVDNRRNQFWSFKPLEAHRIPAGIRPNRVYAAVSSQARNTEEQVIPWDALPLEIAIDSYRDILQSTNITNSLASKVTCRACP
jgi:hypothetical protein